MAQMKIALSGFWENQIEDLSNKFPGAAFQAIDDENISDSDPDALVSLTQTALDALFVPETLAQCASLKWVHASSAGIDEYLSLLGDAGFTLTCGKIIQGPNVADHGMSLLLALARRLPWHIRGAAPEDIPRPTELRGKRALIIGFGGIGMSLAERCAAFGMHVEVVSETLMPIISFVERTYFGPQLLQALPTADVVIIAAPGTPATNRMFNDEAFAAMKESAYLINVSRGSIVDLDALVKTLEAGRLEAVGLDVTEPEPLPGNHPLRGFDRVLITPHIAGITTTHERRFDLIHTNIDRFLNGHPLINIVDKNVGF
jgi:phosphoglycerate dehydrogenase-like enzyme